MASTSETEKNLVASSPPEFVIQRNLILQKRSSSLLDGEKDRNFFESNEQGGLGTMKGEQFGCPRGGGNGVLNPPASGSGLSSEEYGGGGGSRAFKGVHPYESGSALHQQACSSNSGLHHSSCVARENRTQVGVAAAQLPSNNRRISPGARLPTYISSSSSSTIGDRGLGISRVKMGEDHVDSTTSRASLYKTSSSESGSDISSVVNGDMERIINYNDNKNKNSTAMTMTNGGGIKTGKKDRLNDTTSTGFQDQEFSYGPGFVDKLKSRFISLSLREKVKAGALRRFSSLENVLDDDDILEETYHHHHPVKYPPQQRDNNINSDVIAKRKRPIGSSVNNSGGGGGGGGNSVAWTRFNKKSNYYHHQHPSGNNKIGGFKRAKSMETLLLESERRKSQHTRLAAGPGSGGSNRPVSMIDTVVVVPTLGLINENLVIIESPTTESQGQGHGAPPETSSSKELNGVVAAPPPPSQQPPSSKDDNAINNNFRNTNNKMVNRQVSATAISEEELPKPDIVKNCKLIFETVGKNVINTTTPVTSNNATSNNVINSRGGVTTIPRSAKNAPSSSPATNKVNSTLPKSFVLSAKDSNSSQEDSASKLFNGNRSSPTSANKDSSIKETPSSSLSLSKERENKPFENHHNHATTNGIANTNGEINTTSVTSPNSEVSSAISTSKIPSSFQNEVTSSSSKISSSSTQNQNDTIKNQFQNKIAPPVPAATTVTPVSPLTSPTETLVNKSSPTTMSPVPSRSERSLLPTVVNGSSNTSTNSQAVTPAPRPPTLNTKTTPLAPTKVSEILSSEDLDSNEKNTSTKIISPSLASHKEVKSSSLPLSSTQTSKASSNGGGDSRVLPSRLDNASPIGGAPNNSTSLNETPNSQQNSQREDDVLKPSTLLNKKGGLWQKAPPMTTTIVYDFRGKDVKSHLPSNPAPFGCAPARINKKKTTSKKSPREGLSLKNGVDLEGDFGGGESNDYSDDDRDNSDDYDETDVGAHLPQKCGINFIGENAKCSRSSLLTIRNKKLKLQFDDDATSTFEYPSEDWIYDETPSASLLSSSNLLETVLSPDNQRPQPPTNNANADNNQLENTNNIANNIQGLRNTPGINSTGGLSNYTPSMLSSGESSFQLGVSSRLAPSNGSVSNKDSGSDSDGSAGGKVSSGQQQEDEDLLPADPEQTSSWSSSTSTSDLLF